MLAEVSDPAEAKKGGDGITQPGMRQTTTRNKAMQATIIMYNPKKLWGFVQDRNGCEWFFHLDNCVSGFQPSLGAIVEFEVGPPIALGKRDQAVNIAPQKDGVKAGV